MLRGAGPGARSGGGGEGFKDSGAVGGFANGDEPAGARRLRLALIKEEIQRAGPGGRETRPRRFSVRLVDPRGGEVELVVEDRGVAFGAGELELERVGQVVPRGGEGADGAVLEAEDRFPR